CHEKVVRISLEGDEILRVQGEHTQGLAKTLLNTKKGRVKLRRVRAMSITIQSSVKDEILATPSETSKVENALAEMLRDLDQQMEKRADDDAIESTLEDMVRAYVIDFGGSYRSSIRCAPFEALYRRKCRSLVLWAEIGESSLTRLARKPLEFEVGEHVLLKVSPWKGVICFKKKGKLPPRYVEPFEILERIGYIAYRLRLPEELSSVHDTFHVSNLKKCLADANLHVPLDEIEAD
nr:putative reverse transcriptase domain-containing protein [Tanacetum cinerariifolium]